MDEESILILYGSQTGSAQEVAERIEREGIRKGYGTNIYAFDQFPLSKLPSRKVVIFVVSTTGQGETPDNMKNSWAILLRKSLPADLFQHCAVAVFGMGDSSYQSFNFVAKMLTRRLIGLGAKLILERGDGDDQHPLGADGTLDVWLKQLWTKIEAEHLVPKKLPVLPEDLLLPTRYHIHIESQHSEIGKNVRLHRPLEDLGKPPYNSSNPYLSTLLEHKRLSAEDHEKDYRHFDFKLDPSMSYGPGSVLCVLPENADDVISQFLNIQNLNPLDIIYSISPSDSYSVSDGPKSLSSIKTPITVYDFCRYYLDLNGTPKRYFFEVLAHFAQTEQEIDRLKYFSSAEGQIDLRNYNYKEKRTVVEVLADFSSARPPLERLLDVIGRIQPREFSIASAFDVVYPTASLIISIVTIITPYKRVRKGLCTHFLKGKSVGDKVRVWIRQAKKEFTLPKELNVPIIMVGPGTGLAPFRCFTQHLHRIDQSSNKPHPFRAFFFGCQHQNKDFLYEQEWNDYVNDKTLNLFSVAFSRDQPHKIYVQHKMLEHSKEIWEALSQNGVFYLSGSSLNMPKDVRNIMISIVEKEGHMTKTQAEEYIREMEKQNRYCTETYN